MKSGARDDPQTALYALALREVFALEPVAAGLLGLRGGEQGRVGGLVAPGLEESLAAYGFKGELSAEVLARIREECAALARRAADGEIQVWPQSCADCPDREAYNPICRFDSAEWRAEFEWVPGGGGDEPEG
jgi:hypothetical protein